MTIPAPAPEEGTEAVIYLGIPCRDADGTESFEVFPLPTTWSGGKATATADLSFYDNAIAEQNCSDPTPTGKEDISETFARRQAAAVAGGVNVKTAVHFFCETEYLIDSDGGNFRIYIPKSSYNKSDTPVTGKLSAGDGKRIVEELEGLLSYYAGIYQKIRHEDLHMPVVLCTDTDGRYGSGTMKLNWSTYSNGYGRNLSDSQGAYQTMAHELFHYVQREYATIIFSQSWFDEASASWYGIQLGHQRCGDWSTAIAKENYGSDAPVQYEGIVPADVSSTGWLDFLRAGYGRASFIDYLMRYHGSDFLVRYYEQGWTVAGVQTEARLEKLTGKTLGELAVDYYEKMVLQEDAVLSAYSNPAEIYDGSYTPKDALDRVRKVWELTGKNGETFTLSVPRYGAAFALLNMEKLGANAREFTLTVPTADCASRLIAISSSNSKAVYGSKRVIEPTSDGQFPNMPIDGTSYFLMMINETGSYGWTVSEGLRIDYSNFSTGGSYPAGFNEIPEQFSGTLRSWGAGADSSRSGDGVSSTLTVSLEGGWLYFVLSGYNGGSAIASTSGFLKSDGTADCITSEGTHFLVQMRGGRYIDRTKGPKPDPKDDPESPEFEGMVDPFGIYIEGDRVTNGIRIIFFDSFGRMNVFEGEGTNDNSYSYDPTITLP